MSEYIVELKNITKRFPGVVALRDMSLQIKPGEVLGLIGENGAGKSTLIKSLMGVYPIDEGAIFVNGVQQRFHSPNDAKSAGIACVYQELNIVKQLPIVDNIFMGDLIKKNKSILLDYKSMCQDTVEIMKSLGQEVNPMTQAGNLGMGVQQMIEIARAVIQKSKLIIMDEPTSSLGEKEVDQLFQTIRYLKAEGVAILFVSHKLEELFEICDRVTVMRDGEHTLTAETKDLTNDALITAMVGRSLKNLFPKVPGKRGQEALRVEKLSSVGRFKEVSFTAYNGEVLGFSGLVGAGRTEVFRAIFGADPFDSGEVFIHGRKTRIRKPEQAIAQGIAFLTEDRKGQGLVLSQTVKSNMIMASFKRFTATGFLKSKAIEKNVSENIAAFKIKTPSGNEVVAQLSGGNQQKVVIAKWVNTNSDIYIFDEPTRGIDVGAKVEVYNFINSLVEANKCVIMISSELPEIIGMSDRVLVMRSGRIMADITSDEKFFNQEDIIKAAWGGNIYE